MKPEFRPQMGSASRSNVLLRPRILENLRHLGQLTAFELAASVYRSPGKRRPQSDSCSPAQLAATRRALRKLASKGKIVRLGRYRRRQHFGLIGHADPVASVFMGELRVSEIEDLIANFEEQQRRNLTALFDQLRAVVRAPADGRQLVFREHFVDATKAFADAGFEFDDAKIQALCRRHGEKIDDWAIKLGQWYVIEPRFSQFVRLVVRRQARF
jgi:hypothetical protein